VSVRYRPTDRVAARRVEEELLLLDLEKGEYLVSRGVGPLVWDLLGDGRNVDGWWRRSPHGSEKILTSSDVTSRSSSPPGRR
jgi:hypothetical protein